MLQIELLSTSRSYELTTLAAHSARHEFQQSTTILMTITTTTTKNQRIYGIWLVRTKRNAWKITLAFFQDIDLYTRQDIKKKNIQNDKKNWLRFIWKEQRMSMKSFKNKPNERWIIDPIFLVFGSSDYSLYDKCAAD